MKVNLSNKGLTGLRISPEGRLVLVRPSGVTTTDYVWEQIKEFNCSNNRLEALPPLPEGLQVLSCSRNRLTTLPPLPKGLEVLYCSDNLLRSLPSLPEGLQELYVICNSLLRTLPSLPEGLKVLYCHRNQLETLPPLPKGLRELYCANNQLQTLPPLPEGLQELYCENNPFGKGICRDQVPLGVREKIPEDAYKRYDEILTHRKEKFREILGGLTATPS